MRNGNNYTEQNYWDEGYLGWKFYVPSKTDVLRHWIESFLKNGNGKCIEIGCFPGTYLSVFGEHGYELHGIDLTPRVEIDLPKWLKSHNYRIGEFLKVDFADYNPGNKFEIVCSFGFIEHFSNWEEILRKQALLVEDEGYLFVSTPNFRGFVQRLLHSTLDRENYDRHNIESMRPEIWREIIEGLGFNIIYCDAIGPFDFWDEAIKKNRLQKILLRLIYKIMPVLKKLFKKNMMWSSYYGIVAQKRKN